MSIAKVTLSDDLEDVRIFIFCIMSAKSESLQSCADKTPNLKKKMATQTPVFVMSMSWSLEVFSVLFLYSF